jgi:type IV fimbrial biogenesis protein FimT
MDRSRGFTLPEILTVIMIVGFLAVLAFPAMTKFLATQAVRAASYDLNADLVYARSEAIARGTTVTLQAVSNTDFKLGWTIRENAGGTVLRSQPARDSQIQFTGTDNAVTFDRSGRASSLVNKMQFSIVPSSQIDNPQDYMKRCIRLDPSGRPKSTEGACA